jgi:hypothetical protein
VIFTRSLAVLTLFTGKRVDINKIAVPMVRAAVKGGRILTVMAEKGERQTRRSSHDDWSRPWRRCTNRGAKPSRN